MRSFFIPLRYAYCSCVKTPLSILRRPFREITSLALPTLKEYFLLLYHSALDKVEENKKVNFNGINKKGEKLIKISLSPLTIFLFNKNYLISQEGIKIF